MTAAWLLWTLAVVVVASAIGWWYVYMRNKGPNVTPAPPFRTPTAADMLLAKLINAVDHDMRTLELGKWYLDQVRAQVRAGRSCADIDHAAIAARVPGANQVTRAELVNHLRELTRMACASDRPVLDVLDEYEAMALHPRTGVLIGMPGYALRSPVPLP